MRRISKPLGIAAVCVGLAGILYAEGRIAARSQPLELHATLNGTPIQNAIADDPALPSATPPAYDITIVVFSDYQCPYCRRLHGTLEDLRRTDPKVRIVYRDWPIFGDTSIEAARAAMASRYQGKHAAFNDALMHMPGKLDSRAIETAARRAGVDWPRLHADLAKHGPDIDGALVRTDGYARAIGLSGTPALVIGPYLVPGALSLSDIQSTIAVARKHPPERV
jgi:protein-disulfide isomerase